MITIEMTSEDGTHHKAELDEVTLQWRSDMDEYAAALNGRLDTNNLRVAHGDPIMAAVHSVQGLGDVDLGGYEPLDLGKGITH